MAAANTRSERGQPGEAPPPPGADHQRQESLDQLLDRSSLAIQQALAASISSPSAQASRREQAVHLADALNQLPDDYREAFIRRTLEHIPFETIAADMGRSVGAVRMLWRAR